jgi:hypothetical protein
MITMVSGEDGPGCVEILDMRSLVQCGVTVHCTRTLKDVKIICSRRADIFVQQCHFCRIRQASRDGVGVSDN